MGQMPDWKYFRDREGNTYFIDQAGKIRLTTVKKYRYKAVSPRGIDYYLEYGAELIKEHRPIEGLSVLKSICALPNDNNRIYRAQVKAAELVMALRKRNGNRFDRMNESASLMFFQTDEGIEIINDLMRYSLRAPGPVEVIRKVDRAGLDYRYSGILLGILPAGAGDGRGEAAYEMLVAVDTEKFAVPYKNLSEAIEKWKGNIGYEGLTREVLAQDGKRFICSFRNGGEPRYAGIEGVFLNGTYSHYVRLISSGKAYPGLEKRMRTLMDGFRVVGRND
ncbi:MAG: hypothetical protein KA369_18940 [Spirochaetes bacterium]|nr:hypothetical protein [Spirochaetota bacterium]